jgi:flagellin
MNVIIPQSPAIAPDRTPVSRHETLGRSLDRLSAGARIGLPAAAGTAGLAVSERFDAQGKRVQAALTNVQHAASAVQTAGEFLGSLTEILSQLRDLAAPTSAPAAGATVATDSAGTFEALQQQLRQVLGGRVAQLGGEPATAPAVTFDGIELFGPEDQPNPPATTPDLALLPKFRLRSGALTALIRQDGDGNFLLTAADAATGDVLKSALQDVADTRGTLGAVSARLELEAVTLQVESENLSSALTPIRDESAGGEFTRAAAATMLLQPGAALLAQANVVPHGALRLLER